MGEAWWVKPASWGVLRLLWIIYIFIYIHVCTQENVVLEVHELETALATRTAGPCNLMNIAI